MFLMFGCCLFVLLLMDGLLLGYVCDWFCLFDLFDLLILRLVVGLWLMLKKSVGIL